MTFYLTNQPEFMFGHLGSWAVGSAPAMINHHLAGDGLVHCLKVAKSKLLIVDEDSDCIERIEAVRDRIENELGMTIRILDKNLKGEISRMEPKRPGDELRVGIKGTFPMCLFYTRSFPLVIYSRDRVGLTCVVERPDTPKLAPSKARELVGSPAAVFVAST